MVSGSALTDLTWIKITLTGVCCDTKPAATINLLSKAQRFFQGVDRREFFEQI